MSEQSQEFSAKSVDAAIEEGLRQMGVRRDQVEIEVLHEGSRGLLGIGSTAAKVRLTRRALTKPTPAAAPATPPTPAPAPAQPSASPVMDAKAANISAADTDGSDEDEETDAPVSPDADTSDAGADSDDDDSPEDDSADYDSDLDHDEVMALGSELLGEMISLMGLDATVEASLRQEEGDDRPALYLNLVGDDLGSLIGRQGETLASIQYLLRLMVNQKLHRWTNLVVDVDGYKEHRAERLAAMALRMADQVVETGRAVALEPMPANERRLIHIALRNHPSVYTESIGEDTRRKVQILLK